MLAVTCSDSDSGCLGLPYDDDAQDDPADEVTSGMLCPLAHTLMCGLLVPG